MRGKADQATQIAAMAKVVEASAHAAELRAHLAVILESPAFRGSRRSPEFLRHVVEHALNGHFDELKERSIGIAVFGRPATYDTGEDAIVRVTASDVRKRLMQYYAQSGVDSKFRIELVSGSYIPDFHMVVLPPPLAGDPPTTVPTGDSPTSPAPPTRSWRSVLPYAFIAALAGLAVFLLIQNRELRKIASTRPAAPNSMLWSALLNKDRRTVVVIADTAYSAIQDLTGTRIPLSDYANRRYSFNFANPGVKQAVDLLMRRQYTAVQDAAIVAGIAELAGAAGRTIQVKPARNVQVQDFKTDDNFILLGSVASNPWSKLFEDELDYSIEFDPSVQRMVCRNKRPKQGEASSIVPSAVTFASGDAYAHVAFIANPNQSGHILLLAGTIGEGTEAAGKFVTNMDLLGQGLRKANVDPGGAVRHFQAVLHLKVMAGSPSALDVATIHAVNENNRR